MSSHVLFLSEVNKDIRLNAMHVRLALDPGSDITNTTTDMRAFFKNEIRQTAAGYAPQVYTPSSSTYDSLTGRDNQEEETVNFVEDAGGTGYSFNRVLLWYKGTGVANKPIISVDTSANTLSVTSHGLIAGQKVYVRSTAGIGGVPGGLLDQYYYAGNLTTSTLQLFEEEGLTTLVDLTSAGSGTLDLCWADGVPQSIGSVATTTVNPSGTQPVVVRPYAESV